MRFSGQTTRAMSLAASPEAVAGYFARNEDLLAAVVGKARIEVIGDGRYRVALRTFEIPGLAVRPELDLVFTDHPGLVVMDTEAARVLEGPYGMRLDLAFRGQAEFLPGPLGCDLRCSAEAEAEVELAFLTLAEELLETTGSIILKMAMEVMANRFENLLREHFSQ